MSEQQYTIFVRLPIPRGDFVDPPQVDWDTSKDDALWRILSGAAQQEIDWQEVAKGFQVPVDFLLKQVAYLTERHASQVRAQVRKATAAAKGSSAPSPIPGPDQAAGGSGSGHQRTASALSQRRDGSGAGTPVSASIRPNMSRNTSASTAVLRDGGSLSPRPSKAVPVVRPADQSGRRRLTSLPMTRTTSKPQDSPEAGQERSPSPGPAESSSSSSSDDDSSPAQSRIIRRPPRFQSQDVDASRDDDDDDDESEPAFQPYRAAPTPTPAAAQDLASTIRGDSRGQSSRAPKKPARGHIHHSQTSDSSAGSAAMVQRPGKAGEQRTPGLLSPRKPGDNHAGRSPTGGKGKGYSRDGSEGTPSMGSSFSDLDDTSVTQSALEEALASHMNRGSGSSRFSISTAFRSRHSNK